MPKPTKLKIYDYNEKELEVTLDVDLPSKEVYINLDGKELLLPANWALSLSNCIRMKASLAINGVEE